MSGLSSVGGGIRRSGVIWTGWSVRSWGWGWLLSGFGFGFGLNFFLPFLLDAHTLFDFGFFFFLGGGIGLVRKERGLCFLGGWMLWGSEVSSSDCEEEEELVVVLLGSDAPSELVVVVVVLGVD